MNLEKRKFGIDIEEFQTPMYLAEKRRLWNGWDCPWVKQADMDQLVAEWDEITLGEPGWFQNEKGNWEFQDQGELPSVDGYLDVGCGLCWELW